jgi:hypothetical protein
VRHVVVKGLNFSAAWLHLEARVIMLLGALAHPSLVGGGWRTAP